MSLPKSKGWLTEIGVATSRPAAFAVFGAYAAAWVTLGNASGAPTGGTFTGLCQVR